MGIYYSRLVLSVIAALAVDAALAQTPPVPSKAGSPPPVFDDARLKQTLESQKDIKKLDLYGWWSLTDQGFELLRGRTSLESLTLQNTRVTDKGLANLAGLTRLHILDLSRTKVTDAGMEHLRGLTNLEELYLEHTAISDRSMQIVKGFSKLKALGLTETKISDAGLMQLAALTTLEKLLLGPSEVSDAGLKTLSGMKRLRFLECNLATDVGLQHLKGLSSLETLSLSVARVTGPGLENLVGLRSLQEVYLRSSLNDEAIGHLSRLSGLKVLDLGRSQLSPQGASKLKQALPKCDLALPPSMPVENAAPPRDVAVQQPPPAPKAAQTMRAWTDVTAKYHIEAILLGVEGENARLQCKDGSIILVPIDKLSVPDQNYVRQGDSQAQP